MGIQTRIFINEDWSTPVRMFTQANVLTLGMWHEADIILRLIKDSKYVVKRYGNLNLVDIDIFIEIDSRDLLVLQLGAMPYNFANRLRKLVQ